MKRLFFLIFLVPLFGSAQLHWKNVDDQFQPLPASVHVYYTNDSILKRPNHAYYVSVDLKDKSLDISSKATNGKRSTPTQFFNTESAPLLVMNSTFFEFVHNTNVSLVIQEGKQVAYSVQSITRKGKDTLTYNHGISGAIGIDKKNRADVAWVMSDSTAKYAWASEKVVPNLIDSFKQLQIPTMLARAEFKPWKVRTAVAGGPVLVQAGEIAISNNQELKFTGKAINDLHPRTAMGYTADNHLIFMVVEGRFPGKSEGVSLVDEAKLLKDIGCVEALNLDGGGSSCLLINGKETIQPSDKEGQRPVPAVMLIKVKK